MITPEQPDAPDRVRYEFEVRDPTGPRARNGQHEVVVRQNIDSDRSESMFCLTQAELCALELAIADRLDIAPIGE